MNSHIHAFAKEIIEQIIESYGVQEVHEVYEVTDVNTLHTPPKYSKRIIDDVTGKKQESQEVGTTPPPPSLTHTPSSRIHPFLNPLSRTPQTKRKSENPTPKPKKQKQVNRGGRGEGQNYDKGGG